MPLEPAELSHSLAMRWQQGLALCAAVLALPYPGLQSEHNVEALHIPTRCSCPKTINAIARRLITDFTIVAEGAHCPVKQIILSVKVNKKIESHCLDPYQKQGKQLLSCWRRIKGNKRMKKQCIKRRNRKGRKNGSKKQPQGRRTPKRKEKQP